MAKKLLEQLRDTLRPKQCEASPWDYSYRTEEAYLDWVKRYILFHNKRHPKDMGRSEIEAFLTDLAVQRQVAASTQNQALSALLFAYREVFHQGPGALDAIRDCSTSASPIRHPRRRADSPASCRA